MGYRGAPGLLASFLSLLCLGAVSAIGPPFGTPARCLEAPNWSLSTRHPMIESRGQVTVVALLKASWGFSLTQAHYLEVLRMQYISQHITDIKFIVVNGDDLGSRQKYDHFSRLGNYDFYQDNSIGMVWNVLNGSRGNFLIYDRCGQLTYHIPLPYSALRYPFVQIAIDSTYTGSHPCNCSEDIKAVTTDEVELSTLSIDTTMTTAAEPNSL